MLAGHAADEAGGSAVRTDALSGLAQVRDRRQRDHRQPSSFRSPESEMASRRVADQRDPLSVERIAAGELVHELDRPRDVVARPGAAASDVADAPVLDVPGGDA